MVTEGNTGATTGNFTVSLSDASAETVTVHYATGGSDYVGGNGDLTFTPGEKSKIITVQVNGDRTVETNESFLVNFRSR